MDEGRATPTDDPVETSDVRDIYGDAPPPALPLLVPAKRVDFQPWHYPVKHVVRSEQWAALTRNLLEEHYPNLVVLRYFTLPGADMLDVRVLSDVCGPRGISIEYFGFNAAGES